MPMKPYIYFTYPTTGDSWVIWNYAKLRVDIRMFGSICRKNCHHIIEIKEHVSEAAWTAFSMFYGIIRAKIADIKAEEVGKNFTLLQIQNWFDENQIFDITPRQGIQMCFEVWGEYYSLHPSGRKLYERKAVSNTVIDPNEPPPVGIPADIEKEAQEIAAGLKSPTEQLSEVREKVLEAFKIIENPPFLFGRNIFKQYGRDKSQENAEILWFADRLDQLRKAFDESMSSGLARMAVLNELYLRRIDDQLTLLAPDSDTFADLLKKKNSIEENYQSQWKQLEEICPFVKSINNRMSFNGTMGEIIQGYQKFKTNGDNSVLDGLFTAFELQVEMRSSIQAPEPRYRPGLVAAIQEAKASMFDPKWKRTVPDKVYRVMDETCKAIYAKMVESGEIFQPDLAGDGPTSEYEELMRPIVENEVETGAAAEHLDTEVLPETSVAMES